jgi:hypothetical protein
MSGEADTRAAMQRLEDLAAIKRLKYKYLRCVDCKLLEGLGECFTEDATTSYEGGKLSQAGREAILRFFGSDDFRRTVTMHHVHHPEIEITGAGTARATWSLEDYVIDTRANWTLHGGALYEDEYVRVNGEWKIKHTGFKRIFKERWNRADLKSIQLMENMHARPAGGGA